MQVIRKPGSPPARLLARALGGPIDRCCATRCGPVHPLPQELGAMQVMRAGFGVERVEAGR